MKGNVAEKQITHGELLASLTWGYLGLAFPLSGCEGWI
jgi:hypothetical protein